MQQSPQDEESVSALRSCVGKPALFSQAERRESVMSRWRWQDYKQRLQLTDRTIQSNEWYADATTSGGNKHVLERSYHC
jgi:hypothetical protein